MMFINIFPVLVLTAVCLDVVKMHRRNSREEGRELLSEHRSTKYKRSTMYPVYVTFVYEITRHMTLVDRKGLKKRIEKAVRDVNKILEHDADYFTFIKIKQMLAFKNPGRPLKRYTASELSRLLRNNAFFKKYSKNIKSDTTQLVASETPDYKVDDDDYDDEKVNSKSQDRKIQVSTFKDLCSSRSRGIIIDRQKSSLNIANLLTFNIVCAAGSYDKRACINGFRENDAKCGLGKSTSTSQKSTQSKSCFIKKTALKKQIWKKRCDQNRGERDGRMMKISTEDDTSKNDKSNTIGYIFLAISGVLLILAALVGMYLWKMNRNKTKMLTKDRVSVNYKYDAMKRNEAPSVINDPNVTNDLE